MDTLYCQGFMDRLSYVNIFTRHRGISGVLWSGIHACTSCQRYWGLASVHAPHLRGIGEWHLCMHLMLPVGINEGMNQESEGPHRMTITLMKNLRYMVLNLCNANGMQIHILLSEYAKIGRFMCMSSHSQKKDCNRSCHRGVQHT